MAIILAENSCFLQKTTIKTKMYLVHVACQHFAYQLKSPFKKSGTDFLPVPAAYSYPEFPGKSGSTLTGGPTATP